MSEKQAKEKKLTAQEEAVIVNKGTEMPFTGKVGDTLYLPDASHRYVILTKPNNNNNVIATCFTSIKYWKECLVRFTPRHNRRLFKIPTTILYGYSDFFSLNYLTEEAASPISDYIFCPENLVMQITRLS